MKDFFEIDSKIDLEEAMRKAKNTYLEEPIGILKTPHHMFEFFVGSFENSGCKGRHLWVLFDRPLPADVVHNFGQLFCRKVHPLIPSGLHLEFFPKQGSRQTKKGIGNLIKLPLGIHRKTGRRSVFLLDHEPVENWIHYLNRATKAKMAELQQAIEILKRERLPEISQPEISEEPQTPAPPEPAPAWTEADYETTPEIQYLFSQCPVLGALKEKVNKHRTLEREEQLVLAHTAGHIPTGTLAVNHLFSHCGNVPASQFLKSQLKGNPMSCPKIRKKIPHITAKVDCNCTFPEAPQHYPTPTLHLLSVPHETPKPTPEPEPLDTLARRYATLGRKLQEMTQEYQMLGNALAECLKLRDTRTLQLPEGQYRLREHDGIEEIIWEPNARTGHS